MKKAFALEDLDCANCARKMEDAINKLDGVQHCSVNFLAQRMTLEADLETLIEAKTGKQSLVILGDGSAEILLSEQAKESTEMLQITALCMQKTGLSADQITIIEAE